MRSLNKWTRRTLSACSVAIAGFAAAPAHAEVIQLGFILDSSGSITSAGWSLIRTGLANAINLIPTSGPDSYEISVVTFSSTVSTVIDSTIVTSGNKANLFNTISTMAFLNSGTNYDIAFNRMTTLLTDNTGVKSSATQKTYVNFATDGMPNEGTNGHAAEAALIAAGVDNLSVEGIGGSVNASELQNNFCYPVACDATSPYDFPTKGFYIAVANAAAYAAAIEQKIRIVTNQIPEPASLALVGVALAAAGFTRRRRPA